MEQFLSIVTTFPVIVYTFLMAFVILYWLLAMLGALDIDMLDVDADIDVDVDVDVDVDTDINAGSGFDGETESLSGLAGFMARWGLNGVPFTVVLTVWVATAWLLCYLLTSVTLTLVSLDWLLTFLGIAWLILALVLSLPVTAKLVKPMKGMFKSYTAAEKSSFVGKVCVVKSVKVSSDYGQAEFDDGGAGLLFDVRADEAYGIKKGDEVVLMSYDEDEGCYQIKKVS